MAVFLSEKVFSANKESFRYKTNKLSTFGHGIDLPLYGNMDIQRSLKSEPQIVYVGRISKTKRIDFVLETLFLLHSKYNIKSHCIIVGEPLLEVDVKYQADLLKYIKEKDLERFVSWKGALTLSGVINILKEQDIFIHASQTGSLDKAVLDAMMCGVIIYSTNEAIHPILKNIDQSLSIYSPSETAEKLSKLKKIDPIYILELRKKLKNYVESNFSLKNLIRCIIE